jgi:ubiquinone/menaquinone biosynthesis C-methylase UbiE
VSIPNKKALIEQYYNRAASQYYDRHEYYISSNQKARVVAEVFNALDASAILGNKVLDLGCGPGMYAWEMLQRGYEYWGVDISPHVIEEARFAARSTQGASRYHFMVGDIEHLDLPSASFDVVLAVWVLEYLDTDKRVIREMRRVLRPGGIAIVVLNNRRSYNWAIRKLVLGMGKKLPAKHTEWRHSCQQFALRYHKPYEFRMEMEAAGLSLVDGHYFDFHLIPFNLKVPQFYFDVNEALGNLFSFANCNFAFARYIGTFRA